MCVDRHTVVTGISGMADFITLGRYLRSWSYEYRDLARYNGQIVWSETGACERKICAGGEDVEDDWSGIRRDAHVATSIQA